MKQQLQRVFPLIEISLNNSLKLRPLRLEDIDSLCLFLCDDPEMTWSRKVRNRENVNYLLELRLKHYKDFGFGIYGVVFNGQLIGMAGIQFDERDNTKIEPVIYIDRNYWGRKIASSILDWIIYEIFTESNIIKIYASTRPENLRVEYLLISKNFKKVSKGSHYGYPCINWELLKNSRIF